MRSLLIFLIGLSCTLNTMVGHTQVCDSISTNGDVLQITIGSKSSLQKDIKTGKAIHIKLANFNFSNYNSCNLGFRIFLSFDNAPSLNLDSVNYVGSYFTGHDCLHSVFIIPLEETLQNLYKRKRYFSTLYFTFQFINDEGEVMNDYKFLKGLNASILRSHE